MTKALTNSFGLTQRDMMSVTDIFKIHPAVEKVMIFGSRAKGNFKPGSDIDLAICGNQISGKDESDIADLFSESTLPYFVDVVVMCSTLNESLKEHILRVGKVIYERHS